MPEKIRAVKYPLRGRARLGDPLARQLAHEIKKPAAGHSAAPHQRGNPSLSDADLAYDPAHHRGEPTLDRLAGRPMGGVGEQPTTAFRSTFCRAVPP